MVGKIFPEDFSAHLDCLDVDPVGHDEDERVLVPDLGKNQTALVLQVKGSLQNHWVLLIPRYIRSEKLAGTDYVGVFPATGMAEVQWLDTAVINFPTHIALDQVLEMRRIMPLGDKVIGAWELTPKSEVKGLLSALKEEFLNLDVPEYVREDLGYPSPEEQAAETLCVRLMGILQPSQLNPTYKDSFEGVVATELQRMTVEDLLRALEDNGEVYLVTNNHICSLQKVGGSLQRMWWEVDNDGNPHFIDIRWSWLNDVEKSGLSAGELFPEWLLEKLPHSTILSRQGDSNAFIQSILHVQMLDPTDDSYGQMQEFRSIVPYQLWERFCSEKQSLPPHLIETVGNFLDIRWRKLEKLKTADRALYDEVTTALGLSSPPKSSWRSRFKSAGRVVRRLRQPPVSQGSKRR